MSVRCQFLHHHAHLLHRKASGEQDFQLLAHPLAHQDERRSFQLHLSKDSGETGFLEGLETALRSLKLPPRIREPGEHQNAYLIIKNARI